MWGPGDDLHLFCIHDGSDGVEVDGVQSHRLQSKVNNASGLTEHQHHYP
jgi:hypothetical protein